MVLSPLQILGQSQVHVVPRKRLQNVEGKDAESRVSGDLSSHQLVSVELLLQVRALGALASVILQVNSLHRLTSEVVLTGACQLTRLKHLRLLPCYRRSNINIEVQGRSLGSLEEQSAESDYVVELVEKNVVHLFEVNVGGIQARLVDLNESYHWSSCDGVRGASSGLSQNTCLQ